MKINFFVAICFISLLSLLRAQNLEKQVEEIKNSSDYYWGEGVSSNLKEAEDLSLNRLLEQISINIYSSFEGILTETDASISASASRVLKTYSTAALSNVQTIRYPISNGFFAFRFIKKSEVEKIFNERENLAFDMFSRAQEFYEEGNVSSSLKYSYYAIILVNSIPKQTIVREGINLKLELPIFIKKILSSISCQTISKRKINDKEIQYVLSFNIGEKKISSIDFSYWDGFNQISVFASDGKGLITLLGESAKFDKLDVFIKYDFYENKEEIKEVGELWNYVVKPTFSNKIQVDLKNIESEKKENPSNVFSQKKFYTFAKNELIISIEGEIRNSLAEKIGSTTAKFIEILESGKVNEAKKIFAKDKQLQKKFENFIAYNNPKLIFQKNDIILQKIKGGWEIRGLNINCSYSTIRKTASEFLVLEFDESGDIIDFTFGLANAYYENIKAQIETAEEYENRKTILRFAEKYRTAFLTRDIDFLEKVFSEDALIIVGKIVTKKNTENRYVYSELNEKQPSYEQIIYTKKQYIEKQKKNFASLKDIHIGFGGIKVLRKNDLEGVYSLSLRQSYASTAYSDEGYLFLLVDFRDTIPTIYVRSWQPNEWSDEAMIKLSNFRINK